MSTKYKTIITHAGAEKFAAATLPGGKKVNITAMAIGDGGGSLPEPNAGQTKLINEVWRQALNKISQDSKKKNYIVAELVIPPEVGGFWSREMGLYDDTGTMVAVANMAESYKPELAEGSGRAQTVRMVIVVSDITSVELSIDGSVVMATKDYVDDAIAEHEQSRRHPDASLTEKGFTRLNSAIDSEDEATAATPKAVKKAYDLANGKYTAQDATLNQKGLVQLSSTTDSDGEAMAATPKAVKKAYDLASGKYTAQDATLTQKGIVQLSSTINDDETKAATPKALSTVKATADAAVKTVNGRKPGADGNVALGTGANADVQVSRDDVTPGRMLVNGGAIAIRSVAASRAQGSTVTDTNDLPANAVSFVYASAKNSPGFEASILNYAGLNSGYNTQFAASYAQPGLFRFRTKNDDYGSNDNWSDWSTLLTTSGGGVDYLNNARYYNSRQGVWQGGGAFANQYADPTAPFCVPGYTVPKDTSMYLPIVKGMSQTDFYGFVSAVSFGALRSGQNDFGSAVIHIIGDNGASTMFNFQSKDGSFSAPGSVNAGGAILGTNGDVYGPLWGGWISSWLNTQFASAKNLAQDAWNKANDAQINSVRASRRGPQQYINPGENGIWNGFEVPNGYFSGTRNHTDDGNAKFNEYWYRVQQIYIQSQGWVDTGTA